MSMAHDHMKARIRSFRVQANPEMHDRTLRDVLAAHEQSRDMGSAIFRSGKGAATTMLDGTAPAREALLPVRKGKKSIMKTLKRFTPAAAACIVIGIAAVVAFLSLGNGGATIAWADVRAAVEQAQSVCFKMTFRLGRETVTWNVMYVEPGLTRSETPEGISIMDWPAGRILSLTPKAKSAHTTVISGMGNPYHRNWLADLKEIVGSEQAEDLGEKSIAGRSVKGWRVVDDEGTTTVWADAKTAALVQVGVKSDEMNFVMSDFELNRELDRSLFSLKPPDDYKLHTTSTMNASDPSLRDVAELLALCARGNNGVMPDDLNIDKGEFWKTFATIKWTRDDDRGALQATVSRAVSFLYLRLGGWTYAGTGVKVGDADTAVFWYKPKDADTYKVIFGDLSIKDVAEEDIPKEPEK